MGTRTRGSGAGEHKHRSDGVLEMRVSARALAAGLYSVGFRVGAFPGSRRGGNADGTHKLQRPHVLVHLEPVNLGAQTRGGVVLSASRGRAADRPAGASMVGP